MGYTIISPNNLVDLLSNSDGKVYAADTGSSSSLIIDNGTTTDSTATVRNGVAYSSHTVQVSANNINGYSLKITGPTNLTGSTAITGAGNKTPANMANNTWGYAWGSTSTANTNLSYQSFTGSDQTLASNSSATSANFTNKLVFAVKFGDNAASGHYKANVKLNLTVTPQAVAAFYYAVTYDLKDGINGPPDVNGTINATNLSYTIPNTVPTKTGYKFLGYSVNNSSTVHYHPGDSIILTPTNSNIALSAVWVLWFDTITTMQEMTTTICNGATIGAEKSLEDSRDGNSYTIVKASDGNCWMETNLKLDLKNVSSLTTSNTDLASGSSFSGSSATLSNDKSYWGSNDSIIYSTSPTVRSHGSYKTIYGYYYSWCAATANTCKVNGTAISSGDASSSICPKGWKLPLVGSSSDFQVLSQTQAGGQWGANSGIYGKWFGGATAAVGGVYFPAAGYITSDQGLYLANSYSDDGTGAYWSRTSVSSGTAYTAWFNKNQTDLNVGSNSYNNFSKSRGCSVRCIAYSS